MAVPGFCEPARLFRWQELGGSHASEGDLHVTLAAAGSVPDLVALLIGADGRVPTDDDLVFYNNPVSSDGAVAYQGSTGDGNRCGSAAAPWTLMLRG